MGKNKKTPSSFGLGDGYSRVNYLFQAAYLVLKETPANVELARHYVHTLRTVAKRKVMSLKQFFWLDAKNKPDVRPQMPTPSLRHPDMKRVLCKKCCMLLIPGVTSRTNKNGKKQQHMVVTCLDCSTVKRFPTRAAYQLWVHQTEAWVSDNAASQSQKQSAVHSKHGDSSQSQQPGPCEVNAQDTPSSQSQEGTKKPERKVQEEVNKS